MNRSSALDELLTRAILTGAAFSASPHRVITPEPEPEPEPTPVQDDSTMTRQRRRKAERTAAKRKHP